MGALAGAPDEARALLRKLLSVQKQNGSAMHQFNPLTMVGEAGDSAERPEAPQYYSDDHLWAVLAVTAYIKETGDVAFLEEEIPFYERDGEGQALAGGTVQDHLRRGLEFTRNDTGRSRPAAARIRRLE